jgi:hypothetical protein
MIFIVIVKYHMKFSRKNSKKNFTPVNGLSSFFQKVTELTGAQMWKKGKRALFFWPFVPILLEINQPVIYRTLLNE